MDTAGPGPLLPHLRLDDLLDELQVRMRTLLTTRDRVHALYDAVVAATSNLDLEAVLRQIVESAVTLVDAKYGAMGVVGAVGGLAEFIPVGLSEEEIRSIHHWPEGRGLLGALISDPGPLRIADLSSHLQSAGFPQGHPPMTSFLGAPIRIRGEVYGNLYLTEKQGASQFDEEDEAVLVALAAAAGVAIENARLYEEAHRQQHWLTASAEVTSQLLSGAEPAQVLLLIAERALEICAVDLVVLALPTSDGQLLIEHAAGEDAERGLGLVLPADGSASGLVLATGEMLRLQDFSNDDRVAPIARARMRLGPAILVPLGAKGNVRGVLTAGRRPGAMPLTQAAADMLATFAAQAAIALELAEHRRQAERVAVFEDRDRIARDLHDLVIQRLYATGMSLQGARALIGVPEAGRRVDLAVDALDDTIKEIRSSIFALHARSDLQPHGLPARILGVVEEMTGVLGFPPSVQLGGRLDDRVPRDIENHLLSALREALANAARHSGASRVDVTVQADAELVLTVRDNGTGIKPGGRRSGLRNLEQRAAALDGELRTAAADGCGTELVWRVPLRQPADG